MGQKSSKAAAATKTGLDLVKQDHDQPLGHRPVKDKQYGFGKVTVRKFLRLPTDAINGPKFGSFEVGMEIEVQSGTKLGTVEDATAYIDSYIEQEFLKQEKANK